MLTQYFNFTKKNGNECHHAKGWGIMEQGAIALVVIVVITFVLSGLYMLNSRNSVATESANIQTLITSAQGLLQGSNGYSTTPPMIGALIQMGAVPKNMNVKGTPTSGQATLVNSWGGDVTMTPVTINGGPYGFELLYKNVPSDACTQLSRRMRKTGLVHAININNTASTWDSDIGTSCAKSNASVIKFTING